MKRVTELDPEYVWHLIEAYVDLMKYEINIPEPGTAPSNNWQQKAMEIRAELRELLGLVP